jgi:hypothetical protein
MTLINPRVSLGFMVIPILEGLATIADTSDGYPYCHELVIFSLVANMKTLV